MKQLYIICGISFTFRDGNCVDYQVLSPIKGVIATSRNEAFRRFLEDMFDDDDFRAEFEYCLELQQEVVGRNSVEFYKLGLVTPGEKQFAEDFIVLEVPLLK